jgi:S1-C subfamily serine protease
MLVQVERPKLLTSDRSAIMRTLLTGLVCLLVGICGFARSAETVDATAHNPAPKSYIGVTIQDVTPALAQMFGLVRPTGALVAHVEPNGPAALAGIEVGDIILSLGDRTIERYESVRALIAQMPAGSLVLVRLWREGRETLAEVTVAAKSATDH